MKRTTQTVFLAFALTAAYAIAQTTSSTGGSYPSSDQNTTQSAPTSQSPGSTASQPGHSTSPSASAQKQSSEATSADSQQVLAQVQQQLMSDPAFKDVQVSVSGKDTVVLEGSVASKDERKRAKDMVASVPGVRKVKDHLKVNASAGGASSSQNTAGSIAGNTSASAGREPSSSSTVGSGQPSSSAAGTVGSMSGASSATGSNPSSATQQAQIQQAINQQIVNSTVVVNLTTNNIVLTGTVPTEADRARAETIAKEHAPAGVMVVNQINVGTSSPMSSSSSSSGVGGVAGSSTASQTGSVAGQAGSAGAIGSSTSSGTSQTREPAPSASASGQTGAAGTGSTGASSSSDMQTQIQNALQQQNLSGVNVNVTDTNIELSGTVPTGKDKHTAKRIAQSYAGNRKVVDHITVAGKGKGANSSNPSSMGNPPMSETPPTGAKPDNNPK